MSEYKERDPESLDEAGGYYCKHVSAMTEESKEESQESEIEDMNDFF